MYKFFFVVLALVSGCSGFQFPKEPPSADEQETAFTAVWDNIYAAKQFPRPIVNFDQPDCTDDYGTPGIKTPSTGRCLQGWNGQHEIHILWTGDWKTSSFAHELFHAYIIDTTPSWLQSRIAGDPNHEDPRWISIVKDKASDWGAPDLVY